MGSRRAAGVQLHAQLCWLWYRPTGVPTVYRKGGFPRKPCLLHQPRNDGECRGTRMSAGRIDCLVTLRLFSREYTNGTLWVYRAVYRFDQTVYRAVYQRYTCDGIALSGRCTGELPLTPLLPQPGTAPILVALLAADSAGHSPIAASGEAFHLPSDSGWVGLGDLLVAIHLFPVLCARMQLGQRLGSSQTTSVAPVASAPSHCRVSAASPVLELPPRLAQLPAWLALGNSKCPGCAAGARNGCPDSTPEGARRSACAPEEAFRPA